MKFGNEFQKELLAVMLQSRTFLGSHKELVKPEYFSVKHWEEIYEIIYEFAKSYQFPPTQTNIKIIIETAKKEHLLQYIPDLFVERLEESMEFIKDKTVEFARKQAADDVTRKCSELVGRAEEGYMDEIEKLWKKVFAIGLDTEPGERLYEDMDKHIYNRNAEIGEPIGILVREVDQLLNGGICPGELGIVMAGTNVGKSAILCNIGAAAVLQGKTVFHFPLEMTNIKTITRYHARLCNMSIKELLLGGEETNELVKKKLTLWKKRFGGEIFIKSFPTGEATINDFTAYTDRVFYETGLKPDMIIVDYGDIMLHERYKDYRHGIGNSFISLKKMASKMETRCWTATQTNRDGQTKKSPKITDAAEDMEKMRIADIVMTAAQTEEEYENKEMRWLGTKCRDSNRNWVVKMKTKLDQMYIGQKERGFEDDNSND